MWILVNSTQNTSNQPENIVVMKSIVLLVKQQESGEVNTSTTYRQTSSWFPQYLNVSLTISPTYGRSNERQKNETKQTQKKRHQNGNSDGNNNNNNNNSNTSNNNNNTNNTKNTKNTKTTKITTTTTTTTTTPPTATATATATAKTAILTITPTPPAAVAANENWWIRNVVGIYPGNAKWHVATLSNLLDFFCLEL